MTATFMTLAADSTPISGLHERSDMDYKLELVLIPVSDVDRARAFYTEKLGFSLDVDHQPSDEFRVVQMTPPGSACSITIGVGITDAAAGSYRGTHLVVYDIDAAREELVARGVAVSDVRHFDREAGEWRPGSDPEHGDYASFADFADPDGNTWVLQEVRKANPTT
jgi:catechol 2,3-dioxygenase-like lactoylglutathione lyase family enzyme